MPRIPGEGSLERRLAAILCADVQGFGRLMAEDEVGTTRRLGESRAVFRERVAQHRGRIVDDVGDSVLAEFTSVVEAVTCAVDVQRALRERSSGLAPTERMQFRIGVHLGDIIVEGDRLAGTGVNVAARIQALAEPGGVAISASAFEQVQGRGDLRFASLGAQKLRNIPGQVQVYRVSDRSTTPPAGRTPWLYAAGGALLATGLAFGLWTVRGDRAPGPADSAAPPTSPFEFTTEGSPVVYWFLETPPEAPLEFRLHRVDPLELMVVESLETPDDVGVQELDLARFDIELESGVIYFWFVKLVFDPEDASRDKLIGGGILRGGELGS